MWYGGFYPRRDLITKVALSVKDERLFLLGINITAKDATPGEVYKVQPFIVGESRYIFHYAAGLCKFSVEKGVERFFGEIDDAIFTACGLSYLGMYFFCTAYMIKREEKIDPVFGTLRAKEGDQPPQQDKRENEYIFDSAF